MYRFVILVLCFCLEAVVAKKNKSLYCGVCKAVVDEVEYSISQVDPNKKIQLGSYRIDPNGKTRTVQKSFARSETHISELLESVCKEVTDNYVVAKDAKTGKKKLNRMVTRDGKMSGDVDFSALMEDAQKSPETPPDSKSKKVKFACESFVEDYEDELMQHFKSEDETVESLCLDATDYCEEDDFQPKDEL